MYFRAVGIGGFAAVGGTAYGAYHIQQNYPPSGIIYRQGEMITHNGEEKKVVGYFGAPKEVFDQGIDTNRELYYGDKKTAQSYAVARSGTHSKPETAVLVADEMPKTKDHAPQRFEGPHAPLSPSYMKEKNLQVIDREEVTTANRVGLIGSLKRMFNQEK